MRPIIDGHLDLAWNALQWDRDLTRPLGAINRGESHMVDHPERGHAAVSLPEMRRARVGVCPATVLARAKPHVPPAAGASRLDHVCQLAGDARHVGIGSDLDGGFGAEQCPCDFGSIFDLHKLEAILSARGYGAADLDAICYRNWLRFITEALPTSAGDES